MTTSIFIHGEVKQPHPGPVPSTIWLGRADIFIWKVSKPKILKPSFTVLDFFISFSSSSARWHRSNFIPIYFYESRNASLSFILVPYEWDRCWIFASFWSVLEIRLIDIRKRIVIFSLLNPGKVTERGYRTTRRLLWSRIGSQGPDWEYVEVPIMTVFPNYLQEAYKLFLLTDTGQNVQKWTRVFSTRRWI